ncbi:hypothetical protein JCM33374_g850 [Metschnikowia sp. JCM 33374]|nr:hypothetical protein JCM33374_g850 [Metschnikowia sp. JCM 33374]
MDPGSVVLRYSPARWTEMGAGDHGNHAHHDSHTDVPSKIVSFNYTKSPTSSQGRSAPLQHSPQPPPPRKRHLVPLTSSSFERPVKESLENLSHYAHFMKMATKPVPEIEQDWYNDLTNVGQRLKFLRDTFKVVQSVRKRKMMGERADFRSLYDARLSRTGSPSLSDDEMRTNALSEDEDHASPRPAIPVAPANRRGRPPKRRGRERKAPLGRADSGPTPSVGRPPKRARASRRVLEAPSSPREGRRSTRTPEVSAETTPGPTTRRRGRQPAVKPALAPPKSPEMEPQGPPLMHSPPILPSQRLSLVQGIPPYRHLMNGGSQLTPPAYSVPQLPSSVASSSTSAVQPSLSSVPPQVKPQLRAQLNSQGNPQGNPQASPRVKPQAKPQSKSSVSSSLNPSVNPSVNASVNSSLNSSGNASANPQTTPQAKPQTKVPAYLPSQVTFPIPQYNRGSGLSTINGPNQGYLPSQSQLQGVIPFQFQNYQPPPNVASSSKSTTKNVPTSQTGYPLSYATPMNYANFANSTYSSGTTASMMSTPNGESSWGENTSAGTSRNPVSSGSTTRTNLSTDQQMNGRKLKTEHMNGQMTGQSTGQMRNEQQMRAPYQPSNAANSRDLPSIARASVYPQLNTQPSSGMPQYNTWRPSYEAPQADSRGIGLHSRDNGAKSKSHVGYTETKLGDEHK